MVAVEAAVAGGAAVTSTDAASAMHPSQMQVSGQATSLWAWPGALPQNEHDSPASPAG